MAYDTAADIIATACIECGLAAVSDPYAVTNDEQVQMRTLLNQCGRELYTMHQWQQLVRSETISTGTQPEIDAPLGQYPLPDDFGYFINQTGWTPTGSTGMGLPLGGPMTQQQYTYLVATNLANSVIYVSFLIAAGVLQFLPTPAPSNIDITFQYMANGWVDEHGAGTTFASKATSADDEIMFEPVLITKMLVARFKQAKGLEAGASLQQFQAMFAQFTGVNTAAPVLNLAAVSAFPFLNPWRNVPQTGFGS